MRSLAGIKSRNMISIPLDIPNVATHGVQVASNPTRQDKPCPHCVCIQHMNDFDHLSLDGQYISVIDAEFCTSEKGRLRPYLASQRRHRERHGSYRRI